MPATPHIEKHFSASALVRDIVIGMADGLTVPFALAAGLSGAVSSTAIIITAGLAEVAAGGLAMGLGGYLAAQTDLEHYHSELQREKIEIKQVPKTERAEVRQILRRTPRSRRDRTRAQCRGLGLAKIRQNLGLNNIVIPWVSVK